MKHIITIILIVITVCSNNLLDAHSPHEFIQTVAVSPDFDTDRTVLCSLSHCNYFILRTEDGGHTWSPSQQGLPHHRVHSIVIAPDFMYNGVAFAATNKSCVLKSNDMGHSWTSSVLTQTQVDVTSLSVSPGFDSDGTVFAGTAGEKIFKSIDYGESWQQCNNGCPTCVLCLTLSPDYDTDLSMLAGAVDGLHYSTNGGIEWFKTRVSSSEDPDERVTSIAISPDFANDSTIFVGIRGKGVYKSTDSGISWNNISNGISDLFVMDIALSPNYSNDRFVLTATKADGIFSYNDMPGETWHLTNEGLSQKTNQSDTHYYEIAFSPEFSLDNTVYLSTFEGVHISRDRAETWRHLEVYTNRFMRGVGISPDYANDGTVFAGSYGGGILGSTDYGDNWTTQSTGLCWVYAGPLAISPDFTSDGTMFSGAIGEVALSRNYGAAWTVSTHINDDVFVCRSLAVSPDYTNDRTVIGGNDVMGRYTLYKSTNQGTDFLPVLDSTKINGACAIVFSPDYANDDTIFVGSKNGVFRSKDNGDNWSFVGCRDKYISSVVISPGFRDDRIVFCGSYNTGVHSSVNGGDSWNLIDHQIIKNEIIESMGISPQFCSDGNVFAGTKSGGFFKSTDGGASWETTRVLEGQMIRSMAISPSYSADSTIFIGTWEGILRSQDRGVSWTRVTDITYYDDTSTFIDYQLHWLRLEEQYAHGAQVKYSETPGASAELYFYGDSVEWFGAKSPYGGIADVYIDDLFRDSVDLYSSSNKWRLSLYSEYGLTFRPHKITIRATGFSARRSLGTAIVIDAIKVGF